MKNLKQAKKVISMLDTHRVPTISRVLQIPLDAVYEVSRNRIDYEKKITKMEDERQALKNFKNSVAEHISYLKIRRKELSHRINLRDAIDDLITYWEKKLK